MIRELLDALYRPRIHVYNGVAVRDGSRKHADHQPRSKESLREPVSRVVRRGDDVVHVGGGRGIVPVWTKHWAREGSVTVYEASADSVELIESAAELNRAPMDVIHAVVGEPGALWNGSDVGERVNPADLSGDVAVLDCEGAESSILPLPQFETVIAESHPSEDCSTEEVERLTGGTAVREDQAGDGHVVVRSDAGRWSR